MNCESPNGMNKEKKVQVAQGQAAAGAATADLVVNLEQIYSDEEGFGVLKRETQPSNNEITLYDEELRNICSWLGEYDAKTLWIESDEDCIVESMDQKEIHIKENETYCTNDTLVKQFETIGEIESETIGDNLNLSLGREKDNESFSDKKEGEVYNNIVEKGKGKQLEEENPEVEEEEYYLIEEIVEEGEEEEEAGIGEDPKEDEEHYNKVVKNKQCKKRKEFEVFVGGLQRDATREEVNEVFSQVGEVKAIRMATDRWSHKNKGYAFVQYGTVEQAKRAVTELKNPVVRGKRCDVTASQENDTLFVGNICKTWTQKHFEDELKSYGVVNYKEVVLIQDKRYKGVNRGFAFVEFWSLAQATRAYVRLHKNHVFFGTDRAAKVSFAVFDKSDREITFQAKTVFIDGVPPTWDEDRIRSCLQKYGFIESVKLARDMNSAKRPDFGYVTFDTNNSASRCIQGINATGLGKGHHKVKVKAQFCRPRKPRSKWGGAKGNCDISSRAKPSHNFHFSDSPLELDRTSAHISKHNIEISVPPKIHSRFKRPIGSSDMDPTFSVSKRPRHMVSFNRSHRRMLQDEECCVKRNTRDHHMGVKEYNSHVIVEMHSSSCRNEYCYTSSEHAYSDEYYRGRSLDLLPHHSMERPKRMDYSPDMYEDLSIRQLEPQFNYDTRNSRCDPCAESIQKRLEGSHVAYGTGSRISFRDELYGGHDDISYYRGYGCTGDIHGAYVSSSSCDSKYYYQRSDTSPLHFGGDSSYCNCSDSISQGCRNSFRRESNRNF